MANARGSLLRRRPVKQRLREYLATGPVARITEAEWTDLLQRLAPVSESYLRQLIRDTGLPFDQPFAGIRQHSLEELEDSLREMLQVYADAVAAGDQQRARYCRRQVIGAKDRARHVGYAAKTPPAKKAQKEEMVDWMLVWLENPGIFTAWMDARKRLGLPPAADRKSAPP